MKLKIFTLLVLALMLLAVSASAATTRAWIDPLTASVAVGAKTILNVKTNSDTDVSSVEIIGSFDPAKIRPFFTATLIGKDGVAWGTQSVRVTNPTTSTFKLQASTLGGSGNWLGAGEQSVLRIEAEGLSESASGSDMTITSAKVNTVAVGATGLEKSTVTVTAATLTDPCTPNPCLNGGACAGGTCTCTGGYTGDRCQTAVAPPPGPVPQSRADKVRTQKDSLCTGTAISDVLEGTSATRGSKIRILARALRDAIRAVDS